MCKIIFHVGTGLNVTPVWKKLHSTAGISEYRPNAHTSCAEEKVDLRHYCNVHPLLKYCDILGITNNKNFL